VRTGDEREPAVVGLDPRQIEAVTKARCQVEIHRHLTGEPLDDSNHHLLAAERHEVDETNGAILAGDLGFEDERVRAIAPLYRAHLSDGSQRPLAVLFVPEQRREARVRIEARNAHPFDGSMALDERARASTTNHRVVFNLRRHACQRRCNRRVDNGPLRD
jgi:hypothetical protein